MGLSPGRNRRRRAARLTWVGRLVVVSLVLLALGAIWGTSALWRGPARPAPPGLASSAVAPPPAAGDARADWRLDPPLSRHRFEFARIGADEIDPSGVPRLVEWIDRVGRLRSVSGFAGGSGIRRVEYSLDEELTRNVFEILRRGRVEHGHAIVIDPRSGRLLSYVSTAPEDFPPERAYPAASIVKVLMAAALLEVEPIEGPAACTYRGNKYRLNRRRLDPPENGRESTLEDAIASSNNQCFGQWALHVLGEEKVLETLDRFGWLAEPAPGHAAGRVDAIETELDLGRVGSGLDGVRVTPLHVASLASVLTDGQLREPWWVDRVSLADGRSEPLPRSSSARRVLREDQARTLRQMMVSTTTRGTAKSAFRTRRGRPLLGDVRVAGKTGNLSGKDPVGRYEWFVGVAPADDPKIGVVVLQLQGHRWWARSSELAARVFEKVFCDRAGCRAARADRWTGSLGRGTKPMLISDLAHPYRGLSPSLSVSQVD